VLRVLQQPVNGKSNLWLAHTATASTPREKLAIAQARVDARKWSLEKLAPAFTPKRRCGTVYPSIRVMLFVRMRTVKVEYENAKSGRKITMRATTEDSRRLKPS
jgi:hypothetical protein